MGKSDKDMVLDARWGVVEGGSSSYLGVLLPKDTAMFLVAIGDACGITRGNYESSARYYSDNDYYMGDGYLRMDQDDFNAIMDFIEQNDVMTKLNAYVNEGESWVDSGMGDLTPYILQGNYPEGYEGERLMYYAKNMFLRCYIRNQGDIDFYYLTPGYSYSDYDTSWAGTKIPKTGSELQNYYDPMANEYNDFEGTAALTSDIQYMISVQMEPVDEAIKESLQALPIEEEEETEVEPVDVFDWETEDYSDVSLIDSNYYTKQLDTYEENYKTALEKVDNMVTKLTALYDSFNGATGNDITKIRNDLTTLVTDLNSIKTKITNARKKTFDHAFSCAQCYANWYANKDKYKRVSINSDNGHVYGYITVDDEEKYVEATITEMLNS